MLLALDTSSAAVTVALHDGERVLAQRSDVDPLAHGELLAPAIQQVLDEAAVVPAHLDRIVVGVGPGPFTGLRVGIVTARMLAHVLDVEVVGVCSLDVIAAEVIAAGRADETFQVATDARRKEVYVATYDASGRRTSGPEVVKPEVLEVRLPAAGRGAAMYPDAFARELGPEYPSAGVLAAMVADGSADLLSTEPLYLRRPDARETTPRPAAS